MALLELVALICAAATSLICWTSLRLIPILRGKRHAEIQFSPHELRLKEVTLAIVILLFKPVLRLGHAAREGNRTDTEDQLTLSSPFRISEEDVARYERVVGSATRTSSEIPPAALPLFLAAVTEPAMLLLLTNLRCPINSLGAVNV
jgi:hypothetical protein